MGKTIKPKNNKTIFTKNHELNDVTTIGNYFWKRVIDKQGKKLGRVLNIIIINNVLVSLVVLKGFKRYYVDVAFIESMNRSTLKLNIVPVTNNIGKKVFDIDGRHIGKVIDVIKPNEKNEFTDLIVKAGIFSRKKIINKSEIKINDKNIILKTRYE